MIMTVDELLEKFKNPNGEVEEVEEDSIEKVIENFKKLGYRQEMCPKGYDLSTSIAFSRGSIYIGITKNDFQKIDMDEVTCYPSEITIEELKLINRIYSLWGVEV